jgi:hypothetical protein
VWSCQVERFEVTRTGFAKFIGPASASVLGAAKAKAIASTIVEGFTMLPFRLDKRQCRKVRLISQLKIFSGKRDQPHAVAVALKAQPIPVVFDLVKPVRAGRGLGPGRRDAELERAGHGPKVGIRATICDPIWSAADGHSGRAKTMTPMRPMIPASMTSTMSDISIALSCANWFGRDRRCDGVTAPRSPSTRRANWSAGARRK